MISPRLVRLIETHAEQLSKDVAEHLKKHPRTPNFRRLSDSDIHQRVYSVYRNLSAWTTGSEEDVRRTFEALGKERRAERIPLHEVIYALLIHKSHLIHFIEAQGQNTALEMYAEYQLQSAITHFYDLAIYYVAVGYEQAGRATGTHAA